MENAEDEFVAAVDEAMGKMKIVIESPELLKAMADLVAIQLQYFKVIFISKSFLLTLCILGCNRGFI